MVDFTMWIPEDHDLIDRDISSSITCHMGNYSSVDGTDLCPQYDEPIVKNIEKVLENLKLGDNDNSEESTETVIKNKETSPEKENCEKLPDYDAPLSPIPRGEESNIVHSLGMAGKTELESTTGTEDSNSSSQKSSSKYKY